MAASRGLVWWARQARHHVESAAWWGRNGGAHQCLGDTLVLLGSATTALCTVEAMLETPRLPGEAGAAVGKYVDPAALGTGLQACWDSVVGSGEVVRGAVLARHEAALDWLRWRAGAPARLRLHRGLQGCVGGGGHGGCAGWLRGAGGGGVAC